MHTRCPKCHVDHKDLPGYEFFEFAAGSSVCPSCGCFVESPEVETASAPDFDIANSLPDCSDAVLEDVDIETPLFDTEDIEESADAPPILDRDIAIAPTQRTPPFRLSVNKVPPSSDASNICLEIKLTNLTSDEMRGHLWLSDEDGRNGRAKPFTLSPTRRNNSGERNPDSLFPQIQMDKGSSGHLAVRIQPMNCGEAFWQGDLLLSPQKNGSVSVGLNIDNSIVAENYLEGIRNGMSGDIININTSPQQGSDNWHEVRVQLQGPKGLANPADARRPPCQGHKRPLTIREGFEETPMVSTSRLTLSSTLSCGREAYVQLIAGESLHLGRARTWDSKDHRDKTPNDIALRTLHTDEYDDYISRYHGVIRLNDGEFIYENFSSLGSEVAGQSLRSQGETIRLRDNVQIWPGRPALTDSPRKDQSLGLHVRRTPCAVKTELYNLLVQDSHLSSGFDVDQCHDVITLHRTDKVADLEHYVFFPHATFVGKNESICGWRIDDPSVQPIHAILLWFDKSFWIEPYSASCMVRVKGERIPHHRVRRLEPGQTVEIGARHFTVLQEWKQHLVDCRCCKGHG